MRGTNSNKQNVMKKTFCIFFLFLHWQKTRNRNSGQKYTQLLQRLRHFMFKRSYMKVGPTQEAVQTIGCGVLRGSESVLIIVMGCNPAYLFRFLFSPQKQVEKDPVTYIEQEASVGDTLVRNIVPLCCFVAYFLPHSAV
uniref:Uncharacterized protein n=1 Tax=Micrurus paraensis TaxID=1970185 RepID=A0A2D4KA86_9SAUR